MADRERFLRAISPLRIVSLIFSVFPVCPISFKTKNKKLAHVSYIRILYGVICSVLIAGYSLYTSHFGETYQMTLSDNLIFKFAGIAYPFLFLTICLFFFGNSKSYSKLLNEVFEHAEKIIKNKKILYENFLDFNRRNLHYFRGFDHSHNYVLLFTSVFIRDAEISTRSSVRNFYKINNSSHKCSTVKRAFIFTKHVFSSQ